MLDTITAELDRRVGVKAVISYLNT